MNESQRQKAKEKAVKLALIHGMALIRRDLDIYGMKKDASTELISKSKGYDELWADALAVLLKRFDERTSYHASLPKKRMGAGVILFNEVGEILIVKPSYKNYWSIPGGVVEENESPREGALRETKEEIGIKLGNLQFLGVDYYRDEYAVEGLHFLFFGGVLNKKKIAAIKLPKKELTTFQFVPIKKAIKLLGKNLARRLPKCLNALQQDFPGLYLEHGKEIR